MTPAEARAFLASLAPFGMRFGLERMDAVLAALGHPERSLKVLHVAGTNGKGSTCAFAQSMLAQSGARVGLYTSPHLLRVNERIRVGEEEISDEAFARGVTEILKAFPEARSPKDPLTYFELGTALALWHFAQEGVEEVVLETGLGGRLDATNATKARVSVVTRIALDHTAILGETLALIAAEKAGIFKAFAPVVLARQEGEALEVLERMAAAAGQPAKVAGRDFLLEGEGPFTFREPAAGVVIEDLKLGLLGPHQRLNAELAIAAVRRFRPQITAHEIRTGLASTRWAGRLETIGSLPRTLLDGAHNPDGARALAQALAAHFPKARVHLVFGVLGDKDVHGIAQALLPLAHRVYLASPANERALPIGALVALASILGVAGEPHRSVADAVAAAQKDALASGADALVLVAGSLYVVGEARAALLGRST